MQFCYHGKISFEIFSPFFSKILQSKIIVTYRRGKLSESADISIKIWIVKNRKRLFLKNIFFFKFSIEGKNYF